MGNIFADEAIAAGRAYNKFAVMIFKRNGKAIYLRLNDKSGRGDSFADGIDEAANLLERENVLNRAHLNDMLDLFKLRNSLAADALSRRIRAQELRIIFLKLF